MIMVTNNDSTQILIAHKNNNGRQEKPRHLKYLNEFRTQQCLFFLEQQCQFHRPYTCFDWHFPNQRRRRPFKRADGTFNYNPDVYCDKYDETSGSCVDGDDCPYAHRNAGDTERRYHPRYFKTGNCIYETTENGACVKNGLHCAFAHGPDDIRLPVYDVREVQDASSKFTVNLPASLEKERVLSEDPKWNEMFHVLACYKTELCKKPPRMCRQGYSCPFYHNGKDKRRAPDKWRYRSTPCPVVRPGDEWQDSGLCEAGDTCTYCHTRTEQQFHPEIYKSTKCNDVINSGYCPRGPFCAFAHCDSEISIGRDFLTKVQQEQLSVIGGVGLTESSPRVSQLSSGVVVPNLMSPLVNLSGQPPPPITAAAAAQLTTSRGRRMGGRCGSPHHNLGLWQPNTQVGLDRSHHHLSGQLPFMQQSTTTSSATGGSAGMSCPLDTQLPSTAAMLSLTGLSNPGTTGQHLQFCQPRPMTNMFQNVITNSMGSNAAARDKGRHRSGSSVSSSESGLFAFAPPDLTSPTSGPRVVGVSGATFPGRVGGIVPPQSLSFVNPALRTTHPGGPNMKPSSRTPSKKLTQPPQQQQQQPLAKLGPGSFLPDRSGMESTQSVHPIRGHGVGELISGTGVRAGSVQQQQQHQQTSVPLLQNTLWASSNQSDSLSSDRLVGSSWPWHIPIDSGHNSETSITDTSETGGLFEFNTNTGQSATFCGSGGSGGFMPSLLEAASSNRDSGLVLDVSVSGGGMTSTQPRDDFTGVGDLDNQLSSEGLQELIGRSESFLQQLHSTPIRARSGTIVSDGSGGRKSHNNNNNTSMPHFSPSGFLYREQSDYVSAVAENRAPGCFHSPPLDDILFQPQSCLENQSVLMNSLGGLQSDSSPVFDTGNVTGSDPMSIPGRGHESRPNQYAAAAAAAAVCHGAYEIYDNQALHHSVRSETQGAGHPVSSAQLNTSWPMTFGGPTTSHIPAGSNNVTGSSFSSPVASQLSHSFSPVVGTPATNRFTGQMPHNQQQQQQQYSMPISLSTAPQSQHMFDIGNGSASVTSNVLNKSSMEPDVCSLSRDPSMAKLDLCSDSSSSAYSAELGTPAAPARAPATRAAGNRSSRLMMNGSFTNLPQSPILLSSPFNNPGYEVERLSLQRELDEVRQRLDSKEDELEAIKRQRDFVAEHLRDSLGVIQKLFSSIHVSQDPHQHHLSRPLFVDTENAGTGSDQSTSYSAAGFTASDASPMPDDEEVSTDTRHPHRPSDMTYCIDGNAEPTGLANRSADKSEPPVSHQQQSPNEVLLDRRQLEQQQEALAALFANPFVTALLNSAQNGGGGLDSMALNAAQNPLAFWTRRNDAQSGHNIVAPQQPEGSTIVTDTADAAHNIIGSVVTFQKSGFEPELAADPSSTVVQESRTTPA